MQHQKKKRRKKEIKMTESIFSSVWNFSLVSQMSFYGDFWWCGKIVVVFTGLVQMG